VTLAVGRQYFISFFFSPFRLLLIGLTEREPARLRGIQRTADITIYKESLANSSQMTRITTTTKRSREEEE